MIRLNRQVIKAVVASVDWGFTNPGVLQVWALDGDGRMYLVHEVYRTGQLIGWWVERAKEANGWHGPEAFVCDPSEPAYILDFQRAGLNAQPADNALGPGIQAVQERLKDAADGRPRLFVYEGALAERDEGLAERRHPVCTQDEFDAYAWPKAADGRPVKEAPVDLFNHGMDALRYAVRYADQRQRVAGLPPLRGGRAKVASAPPGTFMGGGRMGAW